MDFIKKHFEKILLALVLLVLIGVSGILAYRLREEIKDVNLRVKPRDKSIDRLDTAIYTNTLTGFSQPSTWRDTEADLFDTGLHYTPPPSSPSTNIVPEEPVILISINRKPFKLIWTSYTGEGENIQINVLSQNKSYMGLKVGEDIADRFTPSGYRIKFFEKHEETNSVPGILKPIIVDRSRLIIQKINDPAVEIILIYNTVMTEKDSEAVLSCNPNAAGAPVGVRESGPTPGMPGLHGNVMPGGMPMMQRVGVGGGVASGKQFTVRKGQSFSCGGKTYKVVDINSKQVIIVDESSKETHTINLPGAKE